jgi:hypothetical protein
MLTTRFLTFTVPQRKAQQRKRALHSAHLIWSKRYPEWSAAFFDAHFLRTRVIPLLVACQDELATVDPVILAQAWADQFPGAENRHPRLIAELTPAAADFLQFVVAEERYFVSEAARRQAQWQKVWAQLPFSNAIRSLIERLGYRRSQPVTDCL